MSRAQSLDPDARRAQLLAAALSVFARKGYHGASVSDILDAAGVARGTFYNYFEGKREAFDAVAEALMETVTAAVVPIDVARPIPDQVRDNIARLVEVLLDQGEGVRVLFLDAAGIDEEGTTALVTFYERATGRIERALRTGQRLGVVRDCDAKLTATCLLGMLKEPVLQGLLRGKPPDARKLADEIYALLTLGVVGR